MKFLKAICTSPIKGTIKKEVSSATLIKDHGIKDDAHAGSWHRQVSLLFEEDINIIREKVPELKNGAFGENLILSGSGNTPATGGFIRIGKKSLLKISQIGKECHSPCHIAEKTGKCIMPERGFFATVEESGLIKPGDEVVFL